MTRMMISFILLVILVCTSCSPAKDDAGNFKEQAIEIADYGLFDLGVADINNDDRLDIFTVNHSGRQSLMLNNGSGKFTDVVSGWLVVEYANLQAAWQSTRLLYFHTTRICRVHETRILKWPRYRCYWSYLPKISLLKKAA